MRLIHVRTFPGGLRFIKATLPADVCAHSFINLSVLCAHKSHFWLLIRTVI